jgi:hypothetical protein
MFASKNAIKIGGSTRLFSRKSQFKYLLEKWIFSASFGHPSVKLVSFDRYSTDAFDTLKARCASFYPLPRTLRLKIGQMFKRLSQAYKRHASVKQTHQK